MTETVSERPGILKNIVPRPGQECLQDTGHQEATHKIEVFATGSQ